MIIRIPKYTNQDIIPEFSSINFKKSPSFLGDFSYKMCKKLELLPQGIKTEFERLSALVPAQRFNTFFIQKYMPGENVLEHRDPLNNKDATVVGLYGCEWKTIFWTAERNWSARYYQVPGDVFMFNTTVNGKQGPYHKMSWDTIDPDYLNFTPRYALICNTIEY